MRFPRLSSLVAVVGLWALTAPETRAQTAAVLPFSNTGSATNAAQANLDWIGESIAETVRDALGSRGVLALDHAETGDAYRRLGLRERSVLTKASVLKIGEALDAEHVVYGVFEFTPSAEAGSGTHGSLKISARVLDRKHLKESPEFVETGGLDDLATIEAHLAWRALSLVSPSLAPPENEFRAVRAPVRLDAEENYVRGLLAAASDQKEKYYLQAARLDARFTRPCFQLGRIHYDRKEYKQAADWLQKVAPEDTHYREANFLLGLSLFQTGDFAGAQKAFQMIAETVPLSEVFNNLGAAQSRRNLPQAADSFRKAIEGDANDPVYRFNAGYALWKKGDFPAAAEQLRAALRSIPDDSTATVLLGLCLKKQGPRGNDPQLQALERLKINYEERAYWQLKALVAPSKP